VPLPDGDVTDVDEVGDVYFIVDDFVDRVYSGGDIGGAGQPAPGQSLVLGSDFVVSGTYSIAAGEGSGRSSYIASYDEFGFEIWSNMFGLSSAGGEIRDAAMLTRATDGRIVASVRESSPDRHTLIGCDSNGANPVVFASYARAVNSTNGLSHFARNYPSGYVFVEATADRLQYRVAKIREDFTVEKTVLLDTSRTGVVSDWSIATDPGGSGGIFIATLQDGVFRLNSNLDLVWAVEPGMLVRHIAIDESGNAALTGLLSGSDDGVPILVLNGADGQLESQVRIINQDTSLAPVGRFISIREDGSYVLTSTSDSSSYGWTDHVGISSDLETIDFSVRLSSYLPTSTPFHDCFAGQPSVFSDSQLLFTHQATYGPRDRSIASTGYLLLEGSDINDTAPGTFGPDPKLLVAITSSVGIGDVDMFAGSVTVTTTTPLATASSRIVPVPAEVRRAVYPKGPLPEP
jgi:hypothetical protein